MVECENELKTTHSLIKDIKKMFSLVNDHLIDFRTEQACDQKAEYQKDQQSTQSDNLWRSIGEDALIDIKSTIISRLNKTHDALIKHSYEGSFRLASIAKDVDRLNDMYR